ncbi:hypothetical protein A2392_02820 [Candidatus Kaiserbacteria bacterium RIFOXYB1_FULL_46_14]|uniref:TrbC/VIRB2 family protein n=1 Tax=Candidatus Kaiserbacteria bacterium RIFOXYB1_FULL_46_14 TaxID=1798531 RepID=A0A1F6FIP2_9BACT|nr:MAG: hypothetical protein A2392_02820 [Candidatus Kaiserbacteria bacterium RIFOXYB1_FULL_46_14]
MKGLKFSLANFLLFLPQVLLAQTINDNTGTGVKLQNPLKSTDLVSLLNEILKVIMIFAVPLIVFMIIYAGFLFVMDRGSNKTLEQAKRALLYAVIGGVIILGAQALLAVIQGTVDAFK